MTRGTPNRPDRNPFLRSDVHARIGQAFTTGIGASDLPVAAVGLDGSIIRANRAFADLLGRSRDDIYAVGIDELTVIPSDWSATVIDLLPGGPGRPLLDGRLVRADGEVIEAQTFTTLVRDPAGAPVGWLIAVVDVAKQRRERTYAATQPPAVEKADRPEELTGILDLLCHGVEEASRTARCSVLLLSDDGTIRHGAAPSLPPAYVAAVDGTSIGPEGLSGAVAIYLGRDVVTEDIERDPGWRAWIDLALVHGLRSCWAAPVMASETRHGAGRALGSVAVYWSEPHRPTEAERRHVARVVDLTAMAVERDAAERALLARGLTDPLTGLPNRSRFLARLIEALGRARRVEATVAVLHLDIDGFKLVNDSMGHDIGDRLLRAAAARLQAAVRPHDTVARLGGDEFTIVCENVVGAAEAQVLAERARAALSAPFEIDGRELYLSASCGAAVGNAATPAQLLIDNADAAMYRAKARGRAQVQLYDDELRTTSRRRLKIGTELRHAVGRGELFLHYQPVVDMARRRMVAVEALVRWESSELGPVPPAEFIPIAEETGLITAVGDSVLAAACRQRALWATMWSTPPVVAVNVSAQQLADGGLIRSVRANLQANNLAPSALRLEITETALADLDAGARTLADLAEMGVELAIDDFGTGHSSLARLRGLAVHELKIDQSFVQGLGTDRDDSAFVSAIVALARALGLRVVAEGVETLAQLAEIERLGCHGAQGFLLARPAPAETVTERLNPPV